jgi:hypothetical protein
MVWKDPPGSEFPPFPRSAQSPSTYPGYVSHQRRYVALCSSTQLSVRMITYFVMNRFLLNLVEFSASDRCVDANTRMASLWVRGRPYDFAVTRVWRATDLTRAFAPHSVSFMTRFDSSVLTTRTASRACGLSVAGICAVAMMSPRNSAKLSPAWYTFSGSLLTLLRMALQDPRIDERRV